MMESQALPVPYSTGVEALQCDGGVIGEAARRLASVTVPLLCGTTDANQLLNLLDSISLLSEDLQRHSQVKHYVERICFYLERNPYTELSEKLLEVFPKLVAGYKESTWMSGLPSARVVPPAQPGTARASRACHVPGREVFVLREGEEEVERVALLTMADLRDSLPVVACEMASYEAVWRGASGSTAAALGLKLSENAPPQLPPLKDLPEDKKSVQLATDVRCKSVTLPKTKLPHTGREVVDHILSGMLTDTTYIAYLNKPIPTLPYHLVVVPKSKLNKEHFIMSSFGVMHVVPNGDNEVLSLSKWLRCARIYDYIVDIPFFKHFSLLRQFLRWRINAVLARFKRHRNLIKGELLLTIPTYGKNMIQIQSLICELMTVPEASLEHLIPGTLKNFSDTTEKQRHFLLKYLTRFLQYTKQLHTSADQYLSNRLEEATVNNRPSPEYLTNPISVQKEKRQKRLQYLHLCREQYERMPNYKRAVEFQIQHLVVNFIANSTVHLVDRIMMFISEKSGSLVTVNLVYSLDPAGTDVIISYPCLDSVRETLCGLLVNLKMGILNCAVEWLDPDNRLLQEERIDGILNLNPSYTERVEHYSTVLKDALAQVEEYCQEREWLCEIRCFVRTWISVEKYKGAKAAYIQEVLEKLQFWSGHVDAMVTEFDTSNNLLHITCSALYSALQPALGEIYQSLVDMVLSEFATRGAYLIEETKSKHQMLKSQKAEVSSFAEYAKTLSSVKLNTDELLGEKDYIKSLYGILQKLQIDNPLMAEIDKRLHLQWELYLMVLHDGETFINKEAPAMLQGLDEQIKTLEIEAELILRKISQPDSAFCNPETNHNRIMPLVKESTKKIADLKDTMTKFSDWKFSITNNYHNLQKIQLVQTKVTARHDVWNTLKTVCDTVEAWQSAKFSEFDTGAAADLIREWLQIADYLKSILPEKDKILAKLEKDIEDISKFIPTLMQLSSESVKPHHWQEIHICMGEMYDAKQELLLSHLITNKLLQNKEVISRICGQALTEFTLEQSMLELEQYWEAREFTLRKISIPKANPNSKTRKGGTESVFILDSEDNIVRQIDDHQVLLQSILASPYVVDLHPRAETWLALLQQLHVIMHIWPVCHTNWIYLTRVHVEGKMEVLGEDDMQMFLEMDRDYRQLLIVTWEDPLVMSLFGRKSLSNVRELQGDKLIVRLEVLQRYQETLMSKLESSVQQSREELPRLHFLSDDELLSALTSADSIAVAKHVTAACFPNILDITVEPRMDDKDPPKITHIHGKGGEVVPLIYPVPLSSSLVTWLAQLQAVVVETLHNMMHYSLLNIEHTELKCGTLKRLLGSSHLQNDPYSECGAHTEYIEKEGNLSTWLSDYPYQCLLTTHSVVFTMKLNQWLERKISYADMTAWLQNSHNALVVTLRELNPNNPLSGRKNAAIQAVLLQYLAQRDRINVLRGVEELSQSSFAVLATPRFQVTCHHGRFDWLSANLPAALSKKRPRVDITVSQLTAEMSYDYEYLGRYPRLVISPVTERVHYSLVSAITLRQTLAITGPSNSGKFETIKDYANMLGRYCVEYSDTLKPLLLSNLLSGLIQTGCWVVVRMFERSELLSELGLVLQGIQLGFASLADAGYHYERQCPEVPSETDLFRPSSHEPASKTMNYCNNVAAKRPDTVSRPMNVRESSAVPVPNYLGNIMVGNTLVPASASFQCILTLPPSQSLPPNVKECCRTINMVVPDLDDVILAKLLSAGYKHYEHLSNKLSSFLTYLDPMVNGLELYTLPMVKAILNYATAALISLESTGSEQQSNTSISSVEETMTQIEEERALIDAIVSALTPMLSTHQRGLMKQVLQEVFPLSVSHVYNMSVPPRVKAMVLEQFESNKYEVVPAMLEKTLELYHVAQNRKCVIVAGPTSCGKTTMLRILSNAINFMQATEARASRERAVISALKSIAETSGTPLHSNSKLGTPIPATEPGSRKASVTPALSTDRKWTNRSDVLRGLLNKKTVGPPLAALNVLQKPPEKRMDSGTSGASVDHLLSAQKIRILRLFVNTLTFDEFVGSGVEGSEDGVFINLCKKFSSTTSMDEALQNWILLDGNLKTYMESLLSTAISNHVISSLDASQIRIKDNLQFFIETNSLKDFTPSFITKCGVVMMNSSIVGWRQRFRSWLKKAEKEFFLTKARVFTLTVLMETFIGQMMQFLDVHVEFIMKTDKNHTQQVSALLRWLNVLFGKYISSGGSSTDSSSVDEDYLNKMTVLIFLMAYIWSFGANIEESCIEAFSGFVKTQIEECNHDVGYPIEGTVFDWSINEKQLRFEMWKDFFADVKPQSSLTFTSTVVHETTLYLTEMLQTAGVPVVIVGPASSGKSTFIQNCVFPKLHPTKIKVSHLSNMRQLEDTIESKLIQYQRRQQATASSHTMPSLLIEDFNVIPNRGSKVGLQEVLRKVLASGETYSFKRKVFRNLGSTHLILSCNSVDSIGAGGHVAVGEVIERLWSFFNILPLHTPTIDQWKGIYYPIVLSWLDEFPAHKLGFKSVLASAIVGATCTAYSVLRDAVKPIPGRTHCIFDSHALSQVFQGIFLMSPTSKFRQLRQMKSTVQKSDRTRKMQSISRQKSLCTDRDMIRNVAHLWKHETQRLFSDRISDEETRSEVYRHLTESIRQFFCTTLITNGDNEYKTVARDLAVQYSENLSVNMKKYILNKLQEDLEDVEPGIPLLEPEDFMESLPVIASDLIFTKHLADNGEQYVEERLPVVMEKLNSIMMSPKMEELTNNEHMALYSVAVKHCARLSRSLMLGSHSILLGPCGSGRKILAQLTALAHNYVFRPLPRPATGVSFNEELRGAMLEAGSSSSSVLLFIEDGWDNDAYADLMYFLAEGSHPCFIDSSHFTGGNFNAEVFYKRVQSQLHIVFSLNTNQGELPEKLTSLFCTYPILLKKCTSIDCYSLWSADTLSEIALNYLIRLEEENPIDVLIKDDNSVGNTPDHMQYMKMLANLAASIHLVAYNEGSKEIKDISMFVSPCSFLDLLNIYTIMENRMKSEIMSKLNVLNLVFEKTLAVEEILSTKRAKLAGLVPLLKTAQVVHQGWQDEIKTDKAQYNSSQELCRTEELSIAEKEKELAELNHLNNLDHEEVSPVLEMAVEALNCLSKGDLEELKSFKNPPDLVKFVLEALCVLFDRDTSWESAVYLLQDPRLLSNISNLQKDKIKTSTLVRLKKDYLDDPRFNRDTIAAVSSAATGIQAYISGIYKYSTTIKKLQPKLSRVEKIKHELAANQKSLGKKWLHVEDLKKSLDEKLEHLETSNNQIKGIQATMKSLKKEVHAAESLLQCLEQKIIQWKAEKEDLEQQLLKADGDAMLAAGAITYFGPFSDKTRKQIMQLWKDGNISSYQSFITEGLLPRSPKFDLISALSSPTEQLNLAKRGLPQDTNSLENILIIRELLKNSNRQVLVSDPDDQLRHCASSLLLEPIADQSHADQYQSHPTLSGSNSDQEMMQRGYSETEFQVPSASSEAVFYYSVGELPDHMNRSVAHNTLSVVTGVCEHGTSLPNLALLKENSLLTTTLTPTQLTSKPLKETAVVNFKLSQDGVTNSLLRLVVLKEASHLNSKETAYAKSKLNRMSTIEFGEKSLLEYIANFTGSLLESSQLAGLIATNREMVSNEKVAVADIESRLALLRDKINKYRALAEHGGLIVEVLEELNALSSHYKFKLQDVVETLKMILNQRIESGLSVSTAAKVAGFKKELQLAMYEKLRISMSSQDVHVFPLLLVFKELTRTARMTDQELELFLNNSVHQFPYVPDDIPNWITKSCWQSLDLLEKLAQFRGIKAHMQSNQALYQEYFTLCPVLLEPSPWDDVMELSLVQRTLLWLFCRPADATKVFKDLVMYELGSEIVQPRENPALILSDNCPTLLLSDSDNQGEVVFDIERRAAQLKLEVKVVCMLSASLQLEAERLINQGAKYGYWVVLTQCHEIKEWDQALLDLITEVTEILIRGSEMLPKRAHRNFKLILVSSLNEPIHLPEDLVNLFSVRTHHPEGSLTGRIEQGARMFLERGVSFLGKEDNIPPNIPAALAQLHSYLGVNYQDTENPAQWDHGDLYSTLFLLVQLTTLRKADPIEAARSLVGLVTYGSKSVTDSQTNLLLTATERFLTAPDSGDEDTSPHPSFLQIQLGASLQSLPEISGAAPPAAVLPALPLEKLSRGEECLDVAFVTNYILSSLPTAPRLGSGSRDGTALSQFLSHQAQLYRELLQRITRDLTDIQEVLAGKRTPGPRTLSMMRDLSLNKVPDEWEKSSRGLGRWLSDIGFDRVDKLGKMMGADVQSEMSGRLSSATTVVTEAVSDVAASLQQGPLFYSLSAFTRPADFLLSFLYDWSTAREVPLSDVQFKVKVISLISPGHSPDNGAAYLEGLELIGAGWDSVKSLLYPTSYSSPPFPLPPLLLIPFNCQEESAEGGRHLPQLTATQIECPVYSRNKDFVSSFILPSSHSILQWAHLKPTIRIV